MMDRFLITAAQGAGYEQAVRLAMEVKGYLSEQNKVAHLAGEIDVPETIPDMVIAIGGDGTIMRAMKKYSQYDIPTFGINGGDLGFLASAERENWKQQLLQIGEMDLTIEKRLALQVQPLARENDLVLGPFANEVFLYHPKTQVDFGVHIAGVKYFGDALRARGIMVATPTGSTAQNVAEGGPIILPGSNNVAVTPMNPGMLNVRPLVVDSLEQGEDIVLTAQSFKDGIATQLWADGDHITFDTGALRLGESFSIEAAPKPLLLARTAANMHAVALSKKKGFAR